MKLRSHPCRGSPASSQTHTMYPASTIWTANEIRETLQNEMFLLLEYGIWFWWLLALRRGRQSISTHVHSHGWEGWSHAHTSVIDCVAAGRHHSPLILLVDFKPRISGPWSLRKGVVKGGLWYLRHGTGGKSHPGWKLIRRGSDVGVSGKKTIPVDGGKNTVCPGLST